ncbi:RNA polymerase sigma-70 factor [Sabulilitoribacter arenilitoris]|uniref:RNA polymerase sigma-70 factor n=1 Tax=Wocania arenilitoris TaxID=2044858 RepID=A0AAE3EPN4_9FLAO|nr:RNA polymerase sigma-70 factor [Wocania arenilitoris]MCF7567765.1 RNA polymerase sigma-70 factor [Wocania arenilitoris]
MNFKENKILVEALKKGKNEAYLYLINTYSRRLFAYALTLIDDHALAQDILQNVYLNVWRHRKKLKTKYTIQSFLYKSIYNEFINQHKHKQALSVLEEKYANSLEKVVNNTEELNIDRIINLVNKEIDKLPPRCKQIFILSKKEGLSNIEISEYLGISINTVEVQITKAFKVLREKLGDKVRPLLLLLFGFKNEIRRSNLY